MHGAASARNRSPRLRAEIAKGRSLCPKGAAAVRRWQRQLTEQLAAACLESLIPSAFRGTVQSDGYAGYAAFVRAHNARAGCEAITLAGCWAHARRGFIEARESAPRTVGWLLRQIAALYQIEAHLRACHAGPNLREAVRAAHSVPLVSRIGAALRRIRPRCLPQSAMGKAITYTLDQWPAPGRFLTEGRIEIDNNLVENAIRPTALGKKNWMFIGGADVGHRGAILYIVIEACRRRGLDPFAYLRDVFARLPSMTNWQVKDLTAEAWAKARQPANLRATA